MNPTRALIIRQPWIDLILDNRKTWEMRSTRTKVRGLIGLIEAGSGLIVGEANLTGSLGPLKSHKPIIDYPFHHIEDLDLLKKWPCPWVLEDAKRYDTPIPYQHPKGAVIWVKL